MILSDYHVHTHFCDGQSSVDEMVKRAIELKLNNVGIVCHSFVAFDSESCISLEKICEFLNEVEKAKVRYRGKINVFAGIELDYFSDKIQKNGFDFVISSSHYVKVGEKYLSVDLSYEDQKKVVEENFDGDYYAFCEEYFSQVAHFADDYDGEIIGHFDLVAKFNQYNELFDENDQRYVKAWQKCADKLISVGAIFELNAGALSRGYRNDFYPSQRIVKYLLSKGGRFVYGSDAHSVDGYNLDCIDKYKKTGIKFIK